MKENETLTCKNCRNEIQDKRFKKYCNEIRQHKCVVCEVSFDRKCQSAGLRETCSKSCSSKLVRINTAKNNKLNCERCGNEFNGKSANSKCCNREIEIACKGCDRNFKRKCNNGKGSYCSHSCRNSTTRRNKYKIKKMRTCDICQDEFEANSSRQRFCPKEHYKDCNFCANEFLISKFRWNRINSNKYCDNICSTLSQGNSKIDKSLIKEYKNPNQWALKFKKKNKRKPKKVEFLMYFGLRVPAFADMKLFDKTRDSKLELTVVYYLKSIGLEENIDFFRRQKFKNKDRWIEVDIYFPEQRIGFEVQDFDTHIKEESNLLDKYGNPIKDKRYHQMKNSTLQELDITVYELWEDEIISSDFKNKIESLFSKNVNKTA